MTQNISVQHLINCLKEKEKYKGTFIYIQEIHKFNQKVYDIINVALENVLLKKHQNYMAKLLALRLFKEIVVTGNFTLIDGLNEKIEEEIFKVAQFNKTSKVINRGANYFIQMQHLKKDTEIQKIGSSYVLIASQIIVALANWYPVDEEGEQTRFAQVCQDLKKAGVPLPQNASQLNFFKGDDQMKFKTNYAKWLKWYVDNVKEEDNQDTNKQLKSAAPSLKVTQVKQNKHQKEESLHRSEGKPLTETVPQIIVTTVEKRNIEVKQTVDKQQRREIEEKDFCQKEQEYLKTIESLKEKVEHLQKQIIVSKKSNDDRFQLLQKEKQILQKEKREGDTSREELKKQISELEMEKINMREVLQSNSQKILEMSCLNSELEERINLLERERQANKEPAKDPPKEDKVLESQCYNIKLSPPKEYQDLEQQNEILNSALQTAEIQFKQIQKRYKDQIEEIKQQKKILSEQLRCKIEELEQLKKKKDMGQELIQNIIRQDSLVVQDQPTLVNYKTQPLSNTLNQPQIPRSNIVKNCSVSQYLKSNTKMPVAENVCLIQPRRRSLKKTESQKQLKRSKDNQTFSRTGFDFFDKTCSNKLNKTSNNFRKTQIQANNNVVTYYPFLSDYFKAIPSGNPHFKQFCLHLEQQKGIFFENESIKAQLTKFSPFCYTLILYNKANVEHKIKVLSGHYSFVIEGDKCQKIGPKSYGTFVIKTGQLDLNLRYPIVSVMIGSQRISLSNTVPQDRTIHIPLPLTLLDFCIILPEKDKEWISNGKIGKFSSNKVMISKNNSSLDRCFPYFKIYHTKDRIVAKAGLQIQEIQEARVLVETEQFQGEVTVGIWFDSDSSNSRDFGKVMMQILLFLLQQ